MEIQRVDPRCRGDIRRFAHFPFELYRNTPQWVPPFRQEAYAQLDPDRHPFYQHSDAAFFLALNKGHVVGRIAVLDNRRYNDYHAKSTAFFYLFEAIDDTTVSTSLFEAAFDWAKQRGLNRVWGPKGFLSADGQGILVDGFEHRPALGVPYGLPYYDGLLKAAGFAKSLDFVSCFIDREQFSFPSRYLDLADKIRERRGLRTVTFRTKDELRALIPRITEVYNQSFVEVQGYTPMSEAEAHAIGDRILSIADPSLISLLMKDEDLAGFVIAYPDISAAVQRCRGRIWPTGWYHLKRDFKRTPWLNFNGAGILKPYRGLGGTALLYSEFYNTLAKNSQFRYADLVQVQETNSRMMRELESLGVKPYKRHRVYERLLS